MRIVRFIMPAVLMLALTACSEPTPTPSPTPVPPTPSATATATPIPSTPKATPIPPTPTPTPEAFSLTVDSETTWGDAFDALTATEQGCIRDAVDGDALTQGLEQPIVTYDETTEWDIVAFGCIAPDTARAIFISGTIAWMAAEGIDLNDDDEACLREAVAGVDIRELVSDTDSPAAEQAAYEVLACVPDLLIDAMFETIGDAGVELEPTAEQRACLQEWVANGGGDVLSVGDVPIGVLGCMADALVDIVVHAWLDEGTAETIGEDERSCVQESLEGLLERTPESLDDADAAFLFTDLTFDLLACLPNTLWEQELRQHPSVLWQYDTDTEPYAPVVRGTMLYTSAGNYVHAVDTASGERLWRYGGTFASHSPPTESDGTVYVGWSSPNDGTLLVALDGADGSVLWRASTDYGVALQPVVSGGNVVAGSYDGPVFAVDAETGTPAWESTTYRPTWDSPMTDGGTVYALAGAATAYAFDAATGDVRWEHVTDGTPTTMTLTDGVLYVAGDVLGSEGDVLVEAIDAYSGEGLWEFTLRDVDPELVVADGLMYARAYDGDNLIALDAETGAEVWRFDSTPVSSPPVVSYGVVYIGSFSGSIFELDGSTGELLKEYGPVSYVYIGSLTVGDDAVVYAASGDGRLYAVNLVMPDTP